MPPAPTRLPVPSALVFDLDGTLVDTVPTRIEAWLQVFEEFGMPASRSHVAKLIGIDGRQLAREVAGEGGLTLPEGGDEAIDRRCGEIYGELNRDPRPLPGARELLTWLDEVPLPWAIATSSRRGQVGASVAALDLPREPTIVDGTQVERAKPAPDLLLRAAEELGQSPAGCWCVGDSTWDMRAAAAAGMAPIGITTGSAVTAEELTEAGGALAADTLTELHLELRRTLGKSD